MDTPSLKLQGKFISKSYDDVYRNITASGSGIHSPCYPASVISNASKSLCLPSHIILLLPYCISALGTMRISAWLKSRVGSSQPHLTELELRKKTDSNDDNGHLGILPSVAPVPTFHVTNM